MKYLCTDQDTILFNYINHGIFPVQTTVYNDPIMDEADSFFGGQQTGHIFREISLNIPFRNITVNDTLAIEAFNGAVDAVINHGIPVEQAYENAKQTVLNGM